HPYLGNDLPGWGPARSSHPLSGAVDSTPSARRGGSRPAETADAAWPRNPTRREMTAAGALSVRRLPGFGGETAQVFRRGARRIQGGGALPTLPGLFQVPLVGVKASQVVPGIGMFRTGSDRPPVGCQGVDGTRGLLVEYSQVEQQLGVLRRCLEPLLQVPLGGRRVTALEI